MKEEIALLALREQAMIADLVQRLRVHPNYIYGWKKQLQKQAARAFDRPVGRDAEAEHERGWSGRMPGSVVSGARFYAEATFPRHAHAAPGQLEKPDTSPFLTKLHHL